MKETHLNDLIYSRIICGIRATGCLLLLYTAQKTWNCLRSPDSQMDTEKCMPLRVILIPYFIYRMLILTGNTTPAFWQCEFWVWISIISCSSTSFWWRSTWHSSFKCSLRLWRWISSVWLQCVLGPFCGELDPLLYLALLNLCDSWNTEKEYKSSCITGCPQ